MNFFIDKLNNNAYDHIRNTMLQFVQITDQTVFCNKTDIMNHLYNYPLHNATYKVSETEISFINDNDLSYDVYTFYFDDDDILRSDINPYLYSPATISSTTCIPLSIYFFSMKNLKTVTQLHMYELEVYSIKNL